MYKKFDSCIDRMEVCLTVACVVACKTVLRSCNSVFQLHNVNDFYRDLN